MIWDDVSVSKQLLHSLPIKSSTRHFTFALKDPHHPDSVLYILSSYLLSEQSASDAHDLITTVRPGAVVVQMGSNIVDLIDMEHGCEAQVLYPESLLDVIKESFHNGNGRAKYLKSAQEDVIKAIFGTSFMGYVIKAKHAAKETNSSFYYFECPQVLVEVEKNEMSDSIEDPLLVAKHVSSSLGSSFFSFSRLMPDGVNMYVSQMKLSTGYPSSTVLARYPTLAHLSAERQGDSDSDNAFECPEFAQMVYPFFTELYGTYRHDQGMDLVLQETQKLLINIENGEAVDQSQLSVCQSFRLAVEGLRHFVNNSAQAPLKIDKAAFLSVPFEELPYEDMCYVVLVQALKQQLQKSHRVVAILDAGTVAGVRKYWAYPASDHIIAMAMEALVIESDGGLSNELEISKDRIIDKPIIVVGAGAAAAVGLASLINWAPASTVMKVLSFKLPTVLKLALIKAKKGSISAVAKAAHPFVNSLVPSGKTFLVAKSSAGSKASILKAVSSTHNIRTSVHSVISTAERASLSAIRTAFYNVMRNRHRKGVGSRLWLHFGVSVTACAGLAAYGDRIENAVEILPEASSVSRLCQGLNNLAHAANALLQIEDKQYWEVMYNRLYKEFKH
ncbi:hypothetical protein KP509_02G092600 [Ceratopteris richardii]|uniref:Uncharacterized protein n=1 Tax=Ceratopteris richardii TaxID=49495 RepID=A0A8T2VFM3_CERRI|nr:hypothetical protein KP509_02G092600 [Ceratopteris richardii]